jgi:spermidine synthase
VEIDGDIIKAGNAFFDMEGDNLKSIHMDGRSYLSTTEKKYDIIIIDAYKQPYIPFHLTTTEFFEEVGDHLRTGGIVAINVASLSSESRILNMLANTMAFEFENVYIINPQGSLNYLVMATEKVQSFDIPVDDPELEKIVFDARKHHRRFEFDPEKPVLTDDKAPVEMFIDMMVFDYILTEETREYIQLFE